jgi:hypothetical protein
MRTAVIVVALGLLPLTVFGQTGARIANRSQAAMSASDVPIEARPDGWRYRWHQGYWWYYTPQQSWLRYENNAWKPFIVPPSAPTNPLAQRVAAPTQANGAMFGVDSP